MDSGVDNAVLRSAAAYEVLGMVLAVTSYDNATVHSLLKIAGI